MRTLISDAIHYLEREQDQETPKDAGQVIACDTSDTMLPGPGYEPVQKPGILVAGCGGTGNSVINRLFHRGFFGPRTLVIDHDRQTFRHSHAAVPFLLQHSYFRREHLGVPEGHPDSVAAAAENARPDLEKPVGYPDLCIIVAGMGGNAGTGSAPAVARIAKSRGALVIALLTLPSRLEKTRYGRAQKGLDDLLNIADSVFVLDLNYLLKMMPGDLSLKCMYSVADQVLSETVRNLYERICTPSLVNLDFSDVVHLLAGGGYGTLLIGETREQNFVEGVCRDTKKNRMGDIPLSAITGCIILIEGHYAGLFSSDEIATGICYDLDPRAGIIWGAQEIPSIPEGETRVFALVSAGGKNTGPSFKKNTRNLIV